MTAAQYPHQDNVQSRKRTRTSPNQLAILERTFSMHRSPSGRLREQLSQQLGMTERSIQIWFQNRRAKEKNMAKRISIAQNKVLRMQQWATSAATTTCQMQGGWIAPMYYYHHQQQQRHMKHLPAPSSPPLPPPPASMARAQSASYERPLHSHHESSVVKQRGATMPPYQNIFWSDNVQRQFSADTLEIGSWKRMILLPSSIYCYCDLSNRTMTWMIQDGLLSFKIVFSVDIIQSVRIQQLSEDRAEILLLLDAPKFLSFYMQNQDGWIQCHDFTQDKQATLVPLHRLEGPAVSIWTEWQALLQDLPDNDPLREKLVF
ncbi:homeobox domain-containing protein [Dichotomocladium elegans]|nr:homeobox domain-containing protein [Dichotomocladium elegans]